MALALVLGVPADGPAQPGRYLQQGRTLTDNDFLLYFQYMELARQNADEEAMVHFASHNQLAPGDLPSLALRISSGMLIIENPDLAGPMVAAHGPAINPTDGEKVLFQKYSEDIRRYQSGR
jgi:hypothetical protein